MDGPKRTGPAAGWAVFAAALFLAAAWGRWGTGQEKPAQAAGDAQKWTIERHGGTNFPLVGRHRTVPCAECHVKGVFEGTPTSCEACHWDRRQDDRYRLRLGVQCGDCHTPSAWKNVRPAAWDHEIMTGFRREGIHKTLDCADCHGDGLGKASPDCFSCHAEDYRGVEDPDHVAGGFPTDCAVCHPGQNSWEGAVLPHVAFPLQGRHRTLECAACHPGGRYQGTPADCVACHLEDYNATNDPNHRAAGFPTDCPSCHGTGAVSWEGAAFDHASSFALRGAHATLDCSACHAAGYDLPTDCYGCHAADYNATTDPNHREAGFPTDCVSCHGTGAVTWSGASFDHSQFFRLQGAHTTLDCSACHAAGYDLPTNCYGCHEADYNGTTDPNHRASGFPTTCDNCHYPNHVSWSQAVFQHDFPITSGRHSGFSCSDCHPTSNFREFSCTGCHTRSETDGHHNDVGGYVYNSANCYACHPRGVADD
jgi:hypothetical protein